MAHGEPVLYSLYYFAPDRYAPIAFAVLYAISAAFHVWQCQRYKAWGLVGLHPVCTVTLTVGYAMRAYGATDFIYKTDTSVPLMVAVISQVFVYVCPPLLELANYHVLGRIFHYVPSCAPMPPSRVLATFGGLMGIVEILNSLGVALYSNPSSTPEKRGIGSHLTVAAIAIQVGLVVIFICMAGFFHMRCRRHPNIRSSRTNNTMLGALYASMTLILIRCIYRLLEHTTGEGKAEIDDIVAMRRMSPLLRYEVFFYVFEASLMFINSCIWNVWHPGRLLPRHRHIYLSLEGVEMTGKKHEDKRSILAKVGHVLTMGLLFRRKTPVQDSVEMSETS